MKVYIAGRITGNDNYREEFGKAEACLRLFGHTPLNPATLPDGMKPEDYMRICLAMIDSADMIAFLPGYENSKGARLKLDYARYIHKPYYFVCGRETETKA